MVRLIVLLASFGAVTLSGTLYFEESEEDWICCDSDDECYDAGGKCCDYTSQGVPQCAPGAVGYCREACLIMN
jgi:hypothetical protein